MALGKGIEGDLFFSGCISSNKDTWLIDSSAFKHMTGYKKGSCRSRLIIISEVYSWHSISCCMEHIIPESNDGI